MKYLFVPSCSNDLLRFRFDNELLASNPLEKLSQVATSLYVIKSENRKRRAQSCDSLSSNQSLSFYSSDSENGPIKSCSDNNRSGWKYSCSHCHKRFERPSTLRTHMNSHTGERPFYCPNKTCGRSFTVRSNMMRHYRKCRHE